MSANGFKTVNGFQWPASDTDCAAVVFTRVVDLEVALAHCRAFDVAVQAGGNCGVWPKWLGGWFGTVYTFEPEPENFACLVVNCPEPHIRKFPAALGDTGGPVGIAYPEGPRNMGACCVTPQGPIPVWRVDDLALEACDLIQLDVEGYEPHAIRGALETIRRFRPVLMIEDKGLSVPYGAPEGWSVTALAAEGYRLVTRVERDNVFVYGG